MLGVPDELLPRLQASGRLDLGDFMAFEVGPNPDGAEIENDGLRYEGLRFRAECRLAGTPYGLPFGVDVVFGEPMLGEPDERVADATHGLPLTFPEPHAAWATPYTAMARADGLPWPDLAAVTEAARSFLNPVLWQDLDAVWEPVEASWPRAGHTEDTRPAHTGDLGLFPADSGALKRQNLACSRLISRALPACADSGHTGSQEGFGPVSRRLLRLGTLASWAS